MLTPSNKVALSPKLIPNLVPIPSPKPMLNKPTLSHRLTPDPQPTLNRPMGSSPRRIPSHPKSVHRTTRVAFWHMVIWWVLEARAFLLVTLCRDCRAAL
jgi:hypothetical protein